VIELKSLQKIVGQARVLDIDALTVKAGEIAALIGAVDSGKDTLLRLLTGQSRPTMGMLRVAGIEPRTDRDTFSRSVGVLFSEDSLYTRQSARANLEFHCRLRGLPGSRAEEILELAGLGDHADVKVDKLSTSLARRLAFGRAILHRPTVLVLVEPFARCDDASVSLLSKLMRDIAGEGAAVLILADDNTSLATLCDTIYRLDQGRIVEAYHPAEERRAELPFKIPVRLEGKVVLVNPADILYAVAERGCTYLQTGKTHLPTQFTLTELEERLARSGFFRAHRGYLVNLQHVKEVIPYTRNSFTLRLDDAAETEIPLSKSAAGELSELLGY